MQETLKCKWLRKVAICLALTIVATSSTLLCSTAIGAKAAATAPNMTASNWDSTKSAYVIKAPTTGNTYSSVTVATTVTYLDEHTEDKNLAISGIDWNSSSSYNKVLSGTISYGDYHTNAKTAGPMTASVPVYIDSMYTLTVTSESTTKGTVGGSSGSIAQGTSCTINATPKTGYKFTGWYDGSTQVSTSASYTFNMPSKNYALTAKFELNTFTLSTSSEDINKGTVGGSTGTIVYGTSCTVTATPKAGYKFEGWYEGSTKKSSNASYTFTMPANNVTLQAKFALQEYTVTFDANGGTCGTASKEVTYTNTYGTLPTPTRTGYTFGGWDLGGTVISASSTMNRTADHTLTAIWNINSYKVTLMDLNGSETTETTHEYNSTVRIQAGIKPASWFTSWSIVSGTIPGLNTTSEDTTFAMPAGDVVIRANWNDVESIVVTANSNLYDAYEGSYVEGVGFDVDKGVVTVTKDMIDVDIRFDDQTTVRVINPTYFEIENNVVNKVGITPVLVRLTTITKADGSEFTNTVNIQMFSASLDGLMTQLGINSYSELTDYVNELKGDYESALNDLAKYEAALETYRSQLNSDGQSIVFDTDIMTNIGKIEVGINSVLTDLSSTRSSLTALQNAIIEAGGTGLGAEFEVTDGEITTIVNQIAILKEDITETREELAEAQGVISGLKTLLGLEEEVAMNKILAEVETLLYKLNAANSSISSYESSVDRIYADLTAGAPSDDLDVRLGYVENGVHAVKENLGTINLSLIELAYKNDVIKNGTSSMSVSGSAVTVEERIDELQTYVTQIVNDADTIYSKIDAMKQILGLEADATLDEVYLKVVEVKQRMDAAEAKVAEYSAALDQLYGDMQGDIPQGTLTEQLDSIKNKTQESKNELNDLEETLADLLESIGTIKTGATNNSVTTNQADSIEDAIVNLKNRVNEINAEVTQVQTGVSNIKIALGLEESATLEEVKDKILDIKQDMADAEATIEQYDTAIDELFLGILNGEIPDDLNEKLAGLAVGANAAKTDISGLNAMLVQLLNQAEGVLTGAQGTAVAAQVDSIAEEITDMRVHLMDLAGTTEDILDSLADIRTTLGLEEDASIVEIKEAVDALKQRVTEADEKIVYYDALVKELYASLSGTAAPGGAMSPEDVGNFIEDCRNEITSTNAALNDISQEIKEMLTEVGLTPSAGSGASTLIEVVNDIRDDVATLKTELTTLADFLNEVIEIFDIDVSGGVDTQEILEELRVIKNEYDAYKEAIEQMSSMLGSSVGSNAGIQADLAVMQGKVTALQDKVAELEETIETELGVSNVDDIIEIQSTIRDLKTELNDSVDTVSTLRATIARLEAENTSQANTITQLQNVINELNTIVGGSSSGSVDLDALKEAVEELKELSGGSSDLLAEKNATIKELEDNLTEMGAQLATANTAVATKDAKIAELEEQIEELKNGSGTSSVQVERLKANVALLEAEKSALTSSNTLLRSELTAANTQVSSLQSTNSTLQKEVSTLTSTNKSLSYEVNQLQSTNSSLKSQATSAKSKSESLESEVKSLKDKNSSLTTNNTVLQAELAGVKKENSNLTVENGRLSNEVSGLSVQNNKLAEENLSLEKEVKVLEDKNSNLEVIASQNTNNDEALTSLRNELIQLNTELSNAKTALNTAERKASGLQNEVDTLNKQLEILTSEGPSYEGDGTLGSGEDAELVRAELEMQVMEYERQVKELNDEINALKSSVEVYDETVKEKEVEVIVLQETVTKKTESYQNLLNSVSGILNVEASVKGGSPEAVVPEELETSFEYVEAAPNYSGFRGSELDEFIGISDSTVNGNRVICVDTWNTSSGMLVAEDGFMLSSLVSGISSNSYDVLRSYDVDSPITLENVVLAQVDVVTGQRVVVMFSIVNYVP